MKRTSRVGMKREAVIDPSLEKTLLSLHAAMDVGSFWKAIQQLLAAAIPNRLIGLMLQPNPILPMIARWTLPMPDGFFTAEPLENYVAAQQRQRFVRISDLFSNRSSLMKSAFYRRYMAPQKCAYGVCLFFWKRQKLICVIAIMRTATQGDLSPAEMNLIRQLYPQFLTALSRLKSLEREHSLRMDLEAFLSRLPLPTILLRWNLKPIYQNRAARDFCAVWEKGPEEAQLTKATSPIPSEILDRCRLLKQQWAHARRPIAPQTGFKEERVHHPRSPHLRATLHLKQLSSCGVAQPHFFIGKFRFPTASPTPTPTPTPNPTPTPTPISQCTVPNFIGVRLNRAQSIWSNAGFTTRVTTVGPGGHNITSQSLPAGYVGSCTTTTITVSAR